MKNITDIIAKTLRGSIHRVIKSTWVKRTQFRDGKGRFTGRVRRGHLRVLEREKKLTPVRELIAANIMGNNALLARLKGKGVVRPFTGGLIVEELNY